MNDELLVSDLTRAMLERGDEQVLCAVSNINPQQAISTIENEDSDFMTNVVAFENDRFLCEEGQVWQFAVPVKKNSLTQDEVGL